MNTPPWIEPWVAALRDRFSERHHAWLLIGRLGDGLALAGQALARALLCEAPRSGLACGSCSSCRWMEVGAHPEFLRLGVEDSEAEVSRLPTIKVEQVREAVEFATRAASSLRGRVILIDPADALAPASANALLKALEEPAVGTRWVLLSERPGRLLATLRSRTLRVVLPRPSFADALAFLLAQGYGRERAERALRACRGAALSAQAELDGDGEFERARERFFRELAEPQQLSAFAWGLWVESGGRANRRERFAALLTWLEAWLVDWAKACCGAAPELHDRASSGAAEPEWTQLARALRYHRKLLRDLSLPESSVSPRLQIERMLVEFRAVFSLTARRPG
ncbi:MAG: hypothetical protein RMK02_05575 [Burkholderiales bacterium]|nr:hypothetical protein [Burkholderiales bacterium]